MVNKKNIQKFGEEERDAELIQRARQAGRNEAADEITGLKQKLKATQQIFTTAGNVQALNFTRVQAEFFMIAKLKQIKETREYWEKYGMTWDQFCKECGIVMVTVDKKIKELGDLRDDFLVTLTTLSGVEFNKIKYLGMGNNEMTCLNDKSQVEIKGKDIYFDGEKVPMEAEAINAVLDRLETSYKSQIEAQEKQAKKEKSGLEGQIEQIEKDKRLYQKEITMLSVFKPQDKDKRAVELFEAVDKGLDHIDSLLRQFRREDIKTDADTFAQVNGIMKRIRDRILLFDKDWTLDHPDKEM